MKSKGYISISEIDKSKHFEERFKGETSDKQIQFPKELGAEHPFDFEQVEKICINVGWVNGAINKIKDSVIGDFSIKLKNPNAQILIDSLIKNSDFMKIMESWVKEGVYKGNAFIELDLKQQKMRVMNANNMYVRRDNKGEVIQYSQFTGNLKKFNPNSKKIILFNPNEIAHITLNKIPNDPYGIGYLYPNMKLIDHLLGMEMDLHRAISRKAISPYHFKVGQPGENTDPSIVDSVKSSATYLTNRTEWVTDGNVEIKVIDFPELGKNITDVYMHDFRLFLAGIEVPEVLMGSGQLNEGIAKVQLEIFSRKIKSIRIQIEEIIEKKILRPFLQANGFDEIPTFQWETTSEEEKNKKIETIQKFLSTNTIISSELRASLELELSRLMGFEELEKVLKTPQEAQKESEKEREKSKEQEKEENIPQPEVPGVKPNAKECHNHITEMTENMSIKEFVNLKEIAGFNYTDYLVYILNALKKDKFENLRAITEEDLRNGLLSEKEIQKLKIILKTGFKENKTINEIEREVKLNMDLKDRMRDGKIVVQSSARPNMIVRTETVRLANKGLLDLYKDNKIEQVRWLSAVSDRTCPFCESQNGKVMKLNEAYGEIPAHVDCRCSWISII